MIDFEKMRKLMVQYDIGGREKAQYFNCLILCSCFLQSTVVCTCVCVQKCEMLQLRDVRDVLSQIHVCFQTFNETTSSKFDCYGVFKLTVF